MQSDLRKTRACNRIRKQHRHCMGRGAVVPDAGFRLNYGKAYETGTECKCGGVGGGTCAHLGKKPWAMACLTIWKVAEICGRVTEPCNWQPTRC